MKRLKPNKKLARNNAQFFLDSYSKEGGGGANNPARPPQKGRPKTKDSRGRLLGENDVRAWEGRQGVCGERAPVVYKYIIDNTPPVVYIALPILLNRRRGFYKKLKNVSCEYDRVNG